MSLEKEVSSTDKISIPNNPSSTETSVRMVLQRYRQASLLIDEKEIVTVGNKTSTLQRSLPNVENEQPPCSKTGNNSTSTESSSSSLGLLVYISFSSMCANDKVKQAAKTVLNMPIGTLGAWGDGSSTKSMLQLLTDNNKIPPALTTLPSSSSPLSIMLVPQANLICKVKKNGKSIQYHNQIDKTKGEEFFNLFVNNVRQVLFDTQILLQNGSAGKMQHKKNSNNNSSTPNPAIIPKDLFRQEQEDNNNTKEYATFDDKGIPLTLTNGDKITKSGRKKLQKIYDAHVKRHTKYLQQQRKKGGEEKVVDEKVEQSQSQSKSCSSEQSTKISTNNVKNSKSCSTLDSFFVQLVVGTFGKRQGLEIHSDMGPFCHVVEL